MSLPRLYPQQQVEEAIADIKAYGGYVGWLPYTEDKSIIFIIEHIHLGSIQIQLLDRHKFVIWQNSVPFDTHDTVGYIFQRAQNKSRIP